jgi:hypothetical protein
VQLRIDKALGNALDHWEGLPNDLKSQLQQDQPAFAAAMQELARIVEEV